MLTAGLALLLLGPRLTDIAWRTSTAILRAEDNDQQGLVLYVNSCLKKPSIAEVREDNARVDILVETTVTPLKGSGDCQDVISVRRQEPLGDRLLIDLHTGQPVDVE